MHSPIDLDQFIACDDDEDSPITKPMGGPMLLVVEDKEVQLFTSADWTLVATVGPHEIGRSTTNDKAHTAPYTRRWTRQLIRTNQARLRRLGVDVETAYMKWGGALDDLG